MTADFLDEKRAEIEARIAELAPLVAEWRRLEAAADALGNVAAGSNGAETSRSAEIKALALGSPGRPAVKASALTPKGKRGRPKGSGKRADEAVAIIESQPGIGIKGIAERMGLRSENYLYRVLPGLEAEGRVVRDGKGWKRA